MKKNFLKVAALLIAAMLMVVSCSQEVAPKTEDNGLVDASFSVGFGKDVEITGVDVNEIQYVYSVTPQWNKLTTGAAIYGEVTNKKVSDAKTISQRVTGEIIGYVTPGLWKVTVSGYTNYEKENQKLVVSGETTTYFTKDKKEVTVLVYPVEDGTATVNLELEMQDIEGANSIKVEFLNLSGTAAKTITLSNGTQIKDSSNTNNTAAYKYTGSVTLDETGYYNVKITVPGYDKGGYVRSFLAVNGSTVSIKGSVYPSEFIESKINIISLSLNNLSLENSSTVAGTLSGTKCYNTGNIQFTFTDGNTYLSGSDIEALEKSDSVASVSVAGQPTYEWYLNNDTVLPTVVENDTVLPTVVENDTTKYTIEITTPGVYSVSCVAKYQVSITYKGGSTETKTFKGEAHSDEFIVK